MRRVPATRNRELIDWFNSLLSSHDLFPPSFSSFSLPFAFRAFSSLLRDRTTSSLSLRCTRARNITPPTVPHFVDSFCKLQLHASRIKLIAIYGYAPSTLLRRIKVHGRGETRRSTVSSLTLQRHPRIRQRSLIILILR